jgi:hypothetical protein
MHASNLLAQQAVKHREHFDVKCSKEDTEQNHMKYVKCSKEDTEQNHMKLHTPHPEAIANLLLNVGLICTTDMSTIRIRNYVDHGRPHLIQLRPNGLRSLLQLLT